MVASAIAGALRRGTDSGNRSGAEWIRILQDPSQSLQLRRQAARALAVEGSDAAFTALSQTLLTNPPGLRPAIAEALGRFPRPEARETLHSLLSDPDEATACGAVRGSAAGNPAEAMSTLNQVLYQNQLAVSVRTEAALSLGNLEDQGALPLLTKAAATLKNEQVVAQVLQAIGQRPFDQTEDFYSRYLESPNLETSLRVAAIESVSRAQGDPGAFLLNFAADENTEVRAAAAWAMSAAETQGQYGRPLSEWLERERDPEVRARLYQALGNQESCSASLVAAAIQTETETAPRLAGYTLLAGLLKTDPAGEMRSYFVQHAVPQLEQTALQSGSAHERLASVMALQRARIPETLISLQQIAQASQDPKVIAAAQAALSSATRR